MGFISQIINLIDYIWHHNILTIANKHVAVSNLVIAGLFLLLGIKYYQRFLTLLNFKLIKKLGADKDTINILENLIFYSLFFVFIIITLQIANIPLSIFAFIGGAFAISLGLGAQNLINNFICSLIVLIERPLKISDVIQVGTLFGTVKSIGIRNTIIVSPSGLEVLIPNTMIVNNTLINWTLNNSIIKCKMIFKTIKNLENQFQQVEYTISKLKLIVEQIIEDLPSQDIKISIIGVCDKNFSYLIEFYFELKTINSLEDIKNKFNLELIKAFNGTQFSIEYSKDMELKNTIL